MTLPPCLFKAVAGLPCPSCGLTRSGLAMGQGDWVAAFRFHPLGPLFVVEALAVGVFLAVRRSRGMSLKPAQPIVDRWIVANVTLLLGVWLARLASGWRG
ncbi:MAG TPA: DUF2752 domain-containing protein [Candidatus Eisenbacteria bacterium]